MTINTFRDWWRTNSDKITAALEDRGSGRDGLWGMFEQCWNTAESIELQRCAELTATRLAWEAQVAQAVKAGCLRAFIEERSVTDARLSNEQAPH